MPIIQRPDLVSKIRKTYELVGPDAVATLSPELVPVVVVDDITANDPGVASRFCWGYVSQGGANVPEIWLFNPAASGVDIYLERITVYNVSGAANSELRYFNAAPGTPGTVVNRNSGATGLPVGIVGGENNAVATGAAIGSYRFNNTFIYEYTTVWRLPPGEGIGFSSASGTNPVGDFAWREIASRV